MGLSRVTAGLCDGIFEIAPCFYYIGAAKGAVQLISRFVGLEKTDRASHDCPLMR
jgi:hypothetical protein